MERDREQRFITNTTTDIMAQLIGDVNGMNYLSKGDKDLVLVSVMTSLCASLIGTIAESHNAKDRTAVTNGVFGVLVRGMGEAISQYDGTVGETQSMWSTQPRKKS